MPTIYVDNQPYEVAQGQNLLQACLSLGFNVPYFCWHPAMHSVGACRQCAVKTFKDDKDAAGKIEMACMTPVRDGMRLSIDDPQAVEFRRTVIEWLMVNHPHDCPVCDEGGECHLQDMTVMTGQTYRRFRFKKRTYENQDLGPFVTHEMNRCIQCYRCVRFYRDFAGGRDLEALGWHDRVYFGRHADGRLESEFAGNLVEICPTGVFTDKTLAHHYTRKWDLATAPSVCVHCGLGCNTIPGERYGQLRRVHNRFSAEVNGYFLCDRGRFGYEFVNGDTRIRQAQVVGEDGQPQTLDQSAAMHRLAELVADGGAIGLGSPRASLEANFALRTLVGADRFFAAMPQKQVDLMNTIVTLLRTGPARTPSLREIESADAVFIIGEDLTNVAPMADFAVRQSLRQKALALADQVKVDRWNIFPVQDLMQQDFSPVFVATPTPTKLDEVSSGTFRGAPDEIANLAQRVADILSAPNTPDASAKHELANRIAASLLAAERPMVIAGPSCDNAAILHAAAAVADALCQAGKPAGLFFTAPHCNSMGLALIGAAGADGALQAIGNGQVKTLIVLEGDLHRQVGAVTADVLLKTAKNVVVLDHTQTATSRRAHLVLPAATFAECDGTLVNNEGRAQRFYQVMVPAAPVDDSWRWLAIAAAQLDKPMGRWSNLDDVLSAIVAEMPHLAAIRDIAPPADFRLVDQKVPRQPHRYSGRTAMNANVNVAEPQPPPDDPDSPLAFSMEGYDGQPPQPLLGRYWSAGWNSVQALNKFQQEVGGPLKFSDPGRRLIDPDTRGRDVRDTRGQDARDTNGAHDPEKWLIVPAYHIFGSEELSSLAPAIASIAPAPYVAMNAEDAAHAGLHDGQIVEVQLSTGLFRAPLRITPGLADGLAAVLVGLKDSPLPPVCDWARIVAATSGGRP